MRLLLSVLIGAELTRYKYKYLPKIIKSYILGGQVLVGARIIDGGCASIKTTH